MIFSVIEEGQILRGRKWQWNDGLSSLMLFIVSVCIGNSSKLQVTLSNVIFPEAIYDDCISPFHNRLTWKTNFKNSENKHTSQKIRSLSTGKAGSYQRTFWVSNDEVEEGGLIGPLLFNMAGNVAPLIIKKTKINHPKYAHKYL